MIEKKRRTKRRHNNVQRTKKNRESEREERVTMKMIMAFDM